MRRRDLEITDREAILNIINACEICRIGLYDGKMPYIVPMNFGYTYEDNGLIIYMHGAKKGRKMDIIREYPDVCFEMDCMTKIVEGPRPCDYSMAYKSIMGEGTIEMIEGHESKVAALSCIMKKYAADKEFVFTEARIAPIEVLKLTVTELTAKGSKPKPFQQQ